jgi:hypothetical protein
MIDLEPGQVKRQFLPDRCPRIEPTQIALTLWTARVSHATKPAQHPSPAHLDSGVLVVTQGSVGALVNIVVQVAAARAQGSTNRTAGPVSVPADFSKHLYWQAARLGGCNSSCTCKTARVPQYMQDSTIMDADWDACSLGCLENVNIGASAAGLVCWPSKLSAAV